MADQEDPTQRSPFDFSQAMGAMGDRFGALKGQWDSFLQDPAAQTATMQFAINMMQPPSFGDTGMARIGRALGGAGEAVTRRELLEQQEAESEAKVNLAQARGLAAEASATRREGAADIAEKKLDLARRGQEHRETVNQATQLYRDLKRVSDHNKGVAARNAAAKLKEPMNKALDPNYVFTPEPTLSPEEFFAKFGRSSQVPMGEALGAVAPAASPNLAGRPIPAGAIVDVTTPEEANALPAGTKYRTPEGKTYTR